MAKALSGLDAVAVAELIKTGEVSAVEVAEAALNDVARLQNELGLFLSIDKETAFAQAATVDQKRKEGAVLGPLAGVPIGLKDNLCVRGTLTTCGSKILEGWRSPYDGTAVQKLRDADAVFVGKLNMDEFAMGSSNENSAYFPVKNPYDPGRVPGGSSGGSAASVASRAVFASLGSDTGGSVRQPAAFCNVVALKPTYGRVSRYGLIAFASSLDQIGPFARTTRDLALMTEVISGHDGRDATSAAVTVPSFQKFANVKGLKVGVVRSSLTEGTEPAVRERAEHVLQLLQSMGAQLVDVDLPNAGHALAAYYILAPAECSSNLARFDGMRFGVRANADTLLATYEQTRGDGFGKEVKRRILLGTYVLSAGYYDAYYGRAQKVRTLIVNDYKNAFGSCDVIFTPTSPTLPFKFGAKSSNPLEMYLSDVFTLPASLAGLPAINIPSGLSTSGETGLPTGVQFVAPAFEEQRLFNVSAALEQEIKWSGIAAKVSSSVF